MGLFLRVIGGAAALVAGVDAIVFFVARSHGTSVAAARDYVTIANHAITALSLLVTLSAMVVLVSLRESR